MRARRCSRGGRAWWLADASLLSYWDSNVAQQKFLDLAGLQSEPLGDRGTQGYVTWNDRFALFAFRGTEPDSIRDIVTNVRIPLIAWDVPGERVHSGFNGALADVWPQVVESEPLKKVPVWFTGHSLGAALATLAGDRFARERQQHGFAELGGIYTFGSPLVGDRPFVDGFNTRHRDRSFRFVNDQGTVTRQPPRSSGTGMSTTSDSSVSTISMSGSASQ
jgi:triacylglycerol lipase